MQTTYIFGHRNPDTDSICSSIALSYLKNNLGDKTVPRTIGHINNETKFVLSHFNVETPQYLNDVRIRIKNLKYDKKAIINAKSTILEAYKLMESQKITGLPIVDDAKKLLGFISMKNIARYLINNNSEEINTSLDNIIKTLNAEEFVKIDDLIKGDLKIIGIQHKNFFEKYKLDKNDIVIVGDRNNIIESAIDAGVKLIVISFNSKVDERLFVKARKNKVNVIKTDMEGFKIANTIRLSNYIINLCDTFNPVTIYNDDYYMEFENLTKKTNRTNYPVINHKNECLGMISLSWPNEFDKQKVILVDHNSYAQSVEGIEEAEIMGIYDHHNLGNIGTTIPINFRCMPVGCTATLIYSMYKEYKIVIPKQIAGLMLSAILSDTLLFTSPTVTQADKEAANDLADMCNENIKDYGYKMIKAASSIKELSINEQIFQDYKAYNVGDSQIGLGQLVTLDIDEIMKNASEYIIKLNDLYTSKPGVYALFITDVLKNGSYVLYNEQSKEILKNAFNLENIEQGYFLKNIVSRKKQMLPSIMEMIGK